jgi:hypothetical protein
MNGAHVSQKAARSLLASHGAGRRWKASASSATWERANDQHDALAERLSHVEDTIMNTPAPDGEALLWKMENFFTPEDTPWAEDYADQFYADARRLLGGRGHGSPHDLAPTFPHWRITAPVRPHGLAGARQSGVCVRHLLSCEL